MVFVDYGMEAVVFATMIWEVKVRFFYKIRVFWCDNSSVKDAITDRAMNEAFFVAEDISFVNMTCVYLSFALFAIFVMKNLKFWILSVEIENVENLNFHLKIITESCQVAFKPKMKVLTMCGNLQLNIFFFAYWTTRSNVLCVQVLCVVAQRLIMRYVFV